MVRRLAAAPYPEAMSDSPAASTSSSEAPRHRFDDGGQALSIAPLVSRAIREVFEDGSVTSLFN